MEAGLPRENSTYKGGFRIGETALPGGALYMSRDNKIQISSRIQKVPQFRFLLNCRLPCILATLVFATLLSPVHAAQTKLTWQPPLNSDGLPMTNVNGYKVYWGTASRSYIQHADVGNSTTYTLDNLADGTTYYFAVTDYDNSGNESGYSNEAIKTLPKVFTVTATATAGGSITPVGSVSGGQATNGTSTITTVNVNQGGSLSFTIAPVTDYTISMVTVDDVPVGSVLNYTFANINASHSITATFTTLPNNPIRIAGYATTYQSLQKAYDAAASGAVIQMQATNVVEILNMSKNIPVSISGGYSGDYSIIAGYTKIHGSLLISKGKLNISGIIIG